MSSSSSFTFLLTKKEKQEILESYKDVINFAVVEKNSFDFFDVHFFEVSSDVDISSVPISKSSLALFADISNSRKVSSVNDTFGILKKCHYVVTDVKEVLEFAKKCACVVLADKIVPYDIEKVYKDSSSFFNFSNLFKGNLYADQKGPDLEQKKMIDDIIKQNPALFGSKQNPALFGSR